MMSTQTPLKRIIALDPGYERLGVAILERAAPRDTLLHSDCLRTSVELSFPERLRLLGEAITALINTYSPQAIALERVYFEKNAKTAMQIAEVRGVLTFIGATNGLITLQYTPLEVKTAVTGYGKSDKKAVGSMVERLIALPDKKRLDDELDAIAIGLTALAMTRGTAL